MVCLVLCFVFVITFVNAQISVTVEKDVIDLLKEKTPQCSEETGGSIEILQRILQWHFDDNETSKKFFYCVFKNAGFLLETGHINNEKFLTLFDEGDKKEIANNSFKCNEINTIDPVVTSYKIISCFVEKSSHQLIGNLDK